MVFVGSVSLVLILVSDYNVHSMAGLQVLMYRQHTTAHTYNILVTFIRGPIHQECGLAHENPLYGNIQTKAEYLYSKPPPHGLCEQETP